MSDYVLKYSRGEEIKYISHLDFVRAFARAVRRSGLAMTYSQGFNPHPVISVASPMSVGMTGDGEYLRIGFDEEYSPDEIIRRLNDVFPGLKIKAAAVRNNKKEYDFASIEAADYTVFAETGFKGLNTAGFFGLNEIIIPKKSKSGVRDTDIKPFLFNISSEPAEGGYIIYMRVAAGNSNLKPDTVLDAMKKYTDGFEYGYFTVHRRALLNKEGKELL
ncbi:MAG: DUF2344 domain-containing protein [Oscillospiraceae bacterium]|nr:DUF2344 domain-containing protein [Oscillospiraceae bacterium]